MANLPETPEFVSGIYQIEQTDPVLGGPPNLATGAGLTNVPAQQLAQRTRWLKDHVDQLVADLNGLSIGDVDQLQAALNGKVNASEFVQSFSANGYQVLPSGLILQWGGVSFNVPSTIGITGGVNVTFTFPIAFPNQAFRVLATQAGGDPAEMGEINIIASAFNASQATIRAVRVLGNNDDGTETTSGVVFAVGR